MWRGAAFSAGVVLVLAMVGLAIIGAQRSTELSGVSRALVTKDASFVALGTEVLLVSPDGDVRGVARGADGAAWRFTYVSGLTTDAAGNLYAADGESGQVVRFGPDGAGGVPFRIGLPPARNRRIVALPDGRFFVADTTSHRLAVISADGAVLREQRVIYPNGLTLLPDGPGGEPILYLVETGHRRLFAFDSELKLAETERLKRARAAVEVLGQPAGFRELLDLTADPEGNLVLGACQSTEGECTALRLDPRSGAFTPLANLSFIRAPKTDWGESLMQVSDITFTADGRLLVASPRLASLVEFSPGPGGTLAGGFCSACTVDDVSATVTLAELETAPFELSTGTQARVFGGLALRARFAGHQDVRQVFDWVERSGRTGVMVFAVALLVLLFVLRQSGAVDPSRLDVRMRAVVADIVQPSAVALLVAFGVIAAAGLIGASVGGLVAGTSGAVTGGVGLAVLASRTVGVRSLVTLYAPGTPVAMWRLHFGEDAAVALPLAPGEALQWSALGRRLERRSALAGQVHSAAEAEDPLEAVERLAPHLTLIARTNRRLLMASVSALGAPVDAVASFEVSTSGDASSHELVLVAGAESRFVMPGHARGERVIAGRVSYLCERCFRPAGTCLHAGPRSAVGPVVLSALVPGLGHLLQGRFRRARFVLLAGLGLGMAALYELIPQWFGTLPYVPSRFAGAALGYAVVLGGAMADVLAWQIRMRRRAEVNAFEPEASGGDAADAAAVLGAMK